MRINGMRLLVVVGLTASLIGCSKSEPSGGAGGTTAAAPSAAAPAPPAEAPDVYVHNVMQSILAGDSSAAWNALPAKYQADVKSLINEFAGKMDADVWNKAFALVGKATKVLKEKKDYILGSPVAGMLPPQGKEDVAKNWDAFVAMLDTAANSDLKTLDGLKNVDPGKFLATTGNALLGGALKTAESANPDAKAEVEKARKGKVSLVKVEGDTATLSLQTEGEEAKQKVFKRVEGKWLPAEMVDAWDKAIADAKADMATLELKKEQKDQFLGMAATVESVLDKLLAAKDQKAFDAEVGGLMALIGMFGGGPPGAGAPPGGLPPGAGVPPGIGAPGGLPPGGPALPSGLPGLPKPPATTPTTPAKP